MKVHEPATGAEITLSHVKQKLSAGLTLQMSERVGAAVAAATGAREKYGPTIRMAEPLEIPLPETVKGAIASAKG